MAAIDRTLEEIRALQNVSRDHAAELERLRTGGGGGKSSGMEERVTRLETHMEYVRKDLDEIKGLLKVLPDLATKRDLDSWRWQWLATGIAIIALTVGGITGGLALIAKFAG